MTTSQPNVSLLPLADAVDEDGDASYYRDRLDDRSLIEAAAVIIYMDGLPLIAVPVGGHRLGGFLPVPDIMTGLTVRRLLAEDTGYPQVRVRWSPYFDACHGVEWGARAPAQEDDEVRGRFYGYSAEAIRRFLACLTDSTIATVPPPRQSPRSVGRRA
jgi:hypothetical protein